MTARPFHLVEIAPDVRVGRFPALSDIPGLTHAVTTRHGIDSHRIRKDRAAAGEEIAGRLALNGVAYAEQVHGCEVKRVDAPGFAGECDALMTDTGGLGVMVVSADCPLVLLAERQGRCVGVAHASWRGTVAGVTGELCSAMAREFGVGAQDLVAAIAPSAGPCCYQVGPEVRQAALAGLGARAERFFLPDAEADRWRFDLWAANIAQLRAFGLPVGKVHPAEVCTICSGEDFCSHRVQGESAGRFAAVIAPRAGG
ncbi:MAG: polyphenol oxidase family protein [Planctomycetota bacterium]